MTYNDLISFFVQISAMLLVAVSFGSLMRRLRQPAVFGELIGGILLGPTVVGIIAPGFFSQLFLISDPASIARDAVIQLGMLFFLFIAGLEVNLAQLSHHKWKVTSVSSLGILFPFAIGIGSVKFFPNFFSHQRGTGSFWLLALFIGMALSISALPVVVRILHDLDLIRKDLGQIIIASATINDLIGWALFAVILSNMNLTGRPGKNLYLTLTLVLTFIAMIFIIRSWIGRRAQLMRRKFLKNTGRLLGVIALLILISAAFCEAIGIHGFFGAFMVGVALERIFKRQNQAKESIYHFATSFFAPIYFVSIGLKANFAVNFDVPLVTLIIIIACTGKILGAGIGAWLSGFSHRESLAIGFGLNARGAIEMILASIALEYNLIDERIYVALVVMALVTSIISGPVMNRLLSNIPSKKKKE